MKKSNCLLMGLLAVCILFSGCAENPAENDSSKTPVNPEKEAAEQRYHTVRWDHTILSEDGAYTVQNVFPNSTNLFFADFAAKQQVFLCPNPECSHNDETCPSWFQNDGSFPLSIAKNGESFFVKDDGSAERPPQILQMDLDGTNRRAVLKLGNGEDVGEQLVFHGDALFCEVRGTAGTSIVQVDLKNLQQKTIFEGNETGKSCQLLGAAQEKLLLLQYGEPNPDLLSLYLLDPEQPLLEEPIFEISNEEGGFVLSEGADGETELYLNVSSKREIHKIDLQTKQETIFHYQVPEGFHTLGMHPVYDQTWMLLLCNEDGSKTKCDLLDLDTQNQTEMTLRQTARDYPVVVHGAWKEFLCVKKDSYEYTVNNLQPDGTVKELSFLGEEMALISKEDYQHSIPNYERIVPALR